MWKFNAGTEFYSTQYSADVLVVIDVKTFVVLLTKINLVLDLAIYIWVFPNVFTEFRKFRDNKFKIKRIASNLLPLIQEREMLPLCQEYTGNRENS